MTKKKPTSWAELAEQLDYERYKRRLKAAIAPQATASQSEGTER